MTKKNNIHCRILVKSVVKYGYYYKKGIMMIKIVICDDTEGEAALLQSWVVKYGSEHQLTMFTDVYPSGEQLLKHYGRQYDLLILDIELPGINGVQAAKHIRRQDKEVRIIFATNYQDYAFESFQVEPSGYVLKSQPYLIFAKTFMRTLNHLNARKSPILFRMNMDKYYVELGSIIYVEYFEHKLSVRLMDGTMKLVKGTLKNFLLQDSSGLLLHIHKNCVVNMLWIERCESRRIYMKGINLPFEVSRPKWKEIENRYLIYCKERLM